VALGAAAIPLTRHRQQLHIASEHLHFLIVALVERAMAPQNVGGLTHHQPQVGQVEWNVLEAKKRTAFGVVTGEDLGIELEPRHRQPPLDAAMQLE
jgi:hypothetical protein